MMTPLRYIIDGDELNAKVIGVYFDHLATCLKDRPKLATPGKVVIGLGSGRCGSSSLVGILRNADSCMATHENPPHFGRVFKPEFVTFHLMRFAFLIQYFEIVFDIHPNWRDYIPVIASNFDNVRIIALKRDLDATIASFDHVHHNFDQGVRAYVEEYHAMLDEMKSLSHPSRFLLLQTETLSEPKTQAEIFSFIGRPGKYEDVHLNKGVRLGPRAQNLWF